MNFIDNPILKKITNCAEVGHYKKTNTEPEVKKKMKKERMGIAVLAITVIILLGVTIVGANLEAIYEVGDGEFLFLIRTAQATENEEPEYTIMSLSDNPELNDIVEILVEEPTNPLIIPTEDLACPTSWLMSTCEVSECQYSAQCKAQPIGGGSVIPDDAFKLWPVYLDNTPGDDTPYL